PRDWSSDVCSSDLATTIFQKINRLPCMYLPFFCFIFAIVQFQSSLCMKWVISNFCNWPIINKKNDTFSFEDLPNEIQQLILVPKFFPGTDRELEEHIKTVRPVCSKWRLTMQTKIPHSYFTSLSKLYRSP